jgi:hypothetical protein
MGGGDGDGGEGGGGGGGYESACSFHSGPVSRVQLLHLQIRIRRYRVPEYSVHIQHSVQTILMLASKR